MRTVVFGASGTTGKEILRQLLDQHHEVTAITRNSDHISLNHDLLNVVEADVTNPESFAGILSHAEVIISALGNSILAKPVCATGISNIIDNMVSDQKLIVISAYGANDSNSGFYAKILRLGLNRQMRDKDQMEDLITQSEVNYTIIRPTRLTTGEAGSYQVGDVDVGMFPSISVTNVADLVIKSLDHYDRQVIAITQ